MICESNSTQCSVEVVVRLQPPQNSDIQMLNFQTLSCANRQYFFDFIFPHYTTQDQIYDKIGMKMIASAKKGYNSCIFAYGQTGSGKTYTMTGTDNEDGLIQKCLKGLLKMLEGFQSFELKLSYFEIYNQQVNDLLVTNSGKKNKERSIKIKQSLTLGFYLQNIQQVKVEGITDLIEQLEKGLKNRTTAETRMNRESSRSHSILTLYINTRQKRQNGDGFSIKSSKMHFVDLAGSQKQKSTLAAGDRLKEASSINKSLTSLSIVIQKLSSKANHIPYRDSVLTKILRDSLGGNSRTILIATVSSKEESIAQTISTLNFATKAKKVKLTARVNEEYDGSLLELRRRIKQLESEIKQLKNKENQNKCGNCQILKYQYENLSFKYSQLQNELRQKEQRIQKYVELIQKMQLEHQHQLAELMRRVEQTTISIQDKDNFSRILTDLDTEGQDRHGESKQLIIEEQQRQRNNQFISQDAYYPKLSVIVEQDNEYEGSQTAMIQSQRISQTNSRQQDQRSRVERGQRKSSRIGNKSQYEGHQCSLGSSSAFQIAQLQIIKQLKLRNAFLESEIKNCKLELEHNIRQNQKREEESKRIYEPIIKQWVENNGSIIKQSMKAKNAVELDLILGLKKKVQALKQTISTNEQKWEIKQKEYRSTLQAMMKIQEQFQSLSKKKRNIIEIDDGMRVEKMIDEQNLSKSHPRMSGQRKIPQEASHVSQNFGIGTKLVVGNQCQGNKPNLTKNKNLGQSPFQAMQKLQQQLDRQQLINEQVTRSLQHYKLKSEQLEDEIVQNRELAKFWQNKCSNVIQAKKEIERHLSEAKIQTSNLATEIERKVKIQQEIKTENNLNEVSQLRERENSYLKKISKLQSDAVQDQQAMDKLREKLMSLEESLSILKNQNHNYTVEIQNYRKNLQSWRMNYQKLERNKNEIEMLLGKTKNEFQRLAENHAYTVQNFQRQKNNIKIQHGRLIAQNTSLFMELSESKDRCKLLGIKYQQLKELQERQKIQKQCLTLKNQNLMDTIGNQQSQYFREINGLNERIRQMNKKIHQLNEKNHQLNEEITQHKENLERAEKKQNYLISEFNRQRGDANHWKEECEKQKKWSQDFKKMQEQFMLNQERQRSRQKTGYINERLDDKKKKAKGKSQFQASPLNCWQFKQLKSQVNEIAKKLSEICGIEVTETNLVLKMDYIGEKINSLKMMKEENKCLKAKNKLLTEQRNSQFWKKID